MLFKYFQKTHEFDEKLPIYSMRYLYYGLIMHIMMSWLLLSDDTLLPGRNTEVNYTSYERKD